MTLLKKLLLFGGVPAAGASAAAAPFVLKQLKKEEAKGQVENLEDFDEKENVGNIDISGIETTTNKKDEQIKILKKAGLFCGNSLEDGKECKVYSVGLRLKNGNNVEEGLKISSSSKGKLVLRKNNNTYSYGLRLYVEDGEISLEASGKTPQKLERFESYGIEAEGQGTEKKLYLVRKQTHQQGVMRTLGLPSNCELPLDGQTKSCTPLTSEQIKSVHFDGRKEGGATVSGTQNITLNISKSVDTNLFNQGYRFAFSSPSEITIKEGDVIRTNASTEFTVKEWKDEDMVLVRAGSGKDEEEFFGKVGLKCDSSNVCTIEEGKLNVIKGANNESNKLSEGKKTGGNGTIKLHRDQANYINGLKFSIEKEDITISGNPTDSPVNRLSVFDGYEIVETGKKFFLKRKDVGLDLIVKKLGLFENPSSSVENSTEPVFSTTVSSPDSKKIKFYVNNKPENITDNKAIEAKGYRTTDTTTYKYGYRFSLTSSGGDITIGNTTLKGNVSYDFKIREESGEFYLERTIDPDQIIGLVGLSCTGSAGDETCTFNTGKANIRHWDRNITGANAENQNGAAKLKLTRDQSGFTDGFKFTVEGGDITFTGGTVKTGNIRMAEFEEYEIMRENGTWFLNQKKNFMQQKFNALGIDEKCNNQFYGYCEMEGNNVANNVKFKAKKNNNNVKGSFTDNSKVHIRLEKDPQLTTGIKVSMKVEGGGDDRHVSVVCSENDSTTLLKLTKDKTEFKIEKDGSSFYLTKITGETDVTCNSH